MIAALGATLKIKYTTTSDMPEAVYNVWRNLWGLQNLRVTVDGIIVPSPWRETLSGAHEIIVSIPQRTVPHDSFSANGTTMGGYIDTIDISNATVIEYRAFTASKARYLILSDELREIQEKGIHQMNNLVTVNGIYNGGTLSLPRLESIGADGLGVGSPLSNGNIGKIQLDSLTSFGGMNGISSAIMHITRPTGGFDLEFGPALTTIYGGAIDRCYIKDMIVRATTPPEFISTSAQGGTAIFFQSQLYGNIKVPAASVAAYKAAPGWSAKASQIIAI